MSVSNEVRDTARPRTPLVDDLREAWRFRRLARLLVVRGLTERYQRSLLGAWWSVLVPLLEIGVLWLVFSHAFRRPVDQVPYVVYVASGVVLLNLFRLTVMGVATTLITEAGLLSRVYVPPMLLVLSSAGSVFTNFLLTLVPLLAIMAVSGVAPAATLPLIVVPALATAAFAAGVGLLLAAPTVRYRDLLEVTRIGLILVGYLAPVIYPFSIIPERYRDVIEINPLYHGVVAFRDLLYGAGSTSWSTYAVLLGAGVVSLAVGGVVFSRSVRRAIAVL
jgi:ABC-type polysaccharide/polyol phosphate export permease